MATRPRARALVTAATASQNERARALDTPATARQKERARIVIADNGVGLPEDRSRLFEPYVTTRDKGTGLGLPIVKKIIEEHGGSLRLRDADIAAKARRRPARRSGRRSQRPRRVHRGPGHRRRTVQQ